MLAPKAAVAGPQSADREHAPPVQETLRVYQTGLDGSFAIPKVAPGNYYVVAEAAGYRSATEITREQMDHPTEEIARQMARLLTPVSVAANRGSTVEVRLVRGASLAGVVRYDDGTADGAARVELWRKNAKGAWAHVHAGLVSNSYGGTTTDDTGHFRFSGLQAGQYLVSTQLQVVTMVVNRTESGENEGWSSSSGYTLNVYAPSATREKDAKPVKLGEGQAEEDLEIEVPLTKLHPVSGSLAEQGSGRPVNAGKVTLLFADDGTELASADVGAEGDDEFHLEYVPEGNYVVKVTKAADVVRTEVSNGAGVVPPTHTETKVVRSFGDAEQPLKVESDVSGLVVSVPPAKGAAAAGVQ